MFLQSVSIKNYRSVESVVLQNCGSLNVLIGRNNSGKSTILSSINSAFDFLGAGDVVNTQFRSPRIDDFHKKNSGQTIGMSLILSLTSFERREIVDQIIAEAPQMKNALDGIDPSLNLSITITHTGKPKPFSYISRIAFCQGVNHETESVSMLFKMGKSAAYELFTNRERSNEASQAYQFIESVSQKLDEDDWKRIQREGDPTIIFRYYSIPSETRLAMPSETASQLRKSMAESGSLGEFQRSLQTLALKRLADAETYKTSPLNEKIESFSGQRATVPKYIAFLLDQISRLKVHYLTDRRMQIGREEAGRLLKLKITRGGPEQLVKIQGIVSDLLGVKIDAFEPQEAPVYRDRRPDRPIAELDVDDFVVEVNGSGIREALRLILDVEFGHPDIVLVEEPEMHLHPALEISIMRYLKGISSDCQVFLTTHSTNFLDTPDMKNIYMISKSPSTTVQQIDFDAAESVLPKELGLRLSSLFMFDRLVFVESPTDESVLREFSVKLNVNLGQNNVGFVTMGGVRFLNYFASEKTLSFLMRRQVKTWIIIDRDEKDVLEVDALMKKVGGNTSLRVLERRELENYLLSPRAIIEFIKVKRHMVKDASLPPLPEVREVESMIEREAEALKAFAIQKRIHKVLSKPIYPHFSAINSTSTEDQFDSIKAELERQSASIQEAISTTDDTCKQIATEIEAAWNSRKTDIIPGDMLINKVCNHYGVKFNKERDAVRLASLMTAEEIPMEVRRIIEDFGK